MTRKRAGTISPIVRNLSVEEFARLAHGQRELCGLTALAIERGERITDDVVAGFVVCVLRGHAASIPNTPKRGRGRPPKIDAGGVDHARGAQARREHLEQIALMIERAEPITNPVDVQVAASALRCHADSIPDRPKRGRGRPQTIDAADLALLYTGYRSMPMGHGAAIEKLADAYDASTETVANALVKYRASAAAWFAGFDPARFGPAAPEPRPENSEE